MQFTQGCRSIRVHSDGPMALVSQPEVYEALLARIDIRHKALGDTILVGRESVRTLLWSLTDIIR
jgi:hypothetical protein